MTSAAHPSRSHGQPGMLLYIAWRNIWRNPVRSMLTIFALTGGLVMVILYAALMEGMKRQMVQYATEVNLGHIQIHRQAFIDDRDLYATLPWAYLEAIRERHPNISVSPRLYAAGLASSDATSTGVMLQAVAPSSESRVTQMLNHVRSGTAKLDIADTTATGLSRYNVIVGAQLAKNMQLSPGSELVLVTQAADGSIGNALYNVAAVLKPLEPAFDRMGVLMSVAAYQELMYLQDGFHELVVRVDNIDAVESVQSTLQETLSELTRQHPLDELGGPAVVRNWRQINPTVSDMLEISGTMLLIIGIILVGLASLGMLNTMLMAVHERTQEFGILLAIGMKRWWLLLMVMMESLFLSLVAAASGTVIGVLLSGWLERHGIDFSDSMPDGYDWGGIIFEPVMKGHLVAGDVLFACLLMVGVTLLASLIPSWRTVRLKPAEVMR